MHSLTWVRGKPCSWNDCFTSKWHLGSFFFFFDNLYYYLKGFSLFGFFIFQLKNAPTPLCLSRDKIKGHSGKNATVTPTKTLPKKQDYSPIIFQITSYTYKLDSFLKKKKTYKLDSQNKNTGFFFAGKKKPHHTRVAHVMRLVIIYFSLYLRVNTGV